MNLIIHLVLFVILSVILASAGILYNKSNYWAIVITVLAIFLNGVLIGINI